MTAGESTLSPNTLLIAGIAIQALPLDDELVVYDPLRNKVYRLNGTAAFIWRSLAERTSIAGLTEQLESHFGLSKKLASAEVEDFIPQLIDAGLVGADSDGKIE